jgi:hypothetical protein
MIKSLRFCGIVLRREEAISVLKELLESCRGFDGQNLELVNTKVATSSSEGYQIIIKGTLNQETKEGLQKIVFAHQLACQTGSLWKTKRSINKTDPDTFIIYRPHIGK